MISRFFIPYKLLKLIYMVADLHCSGSNQINDQSYNKKHSMFLTLQWICQKSKNKISSTSSTGIILAFSFNFKHT